MVDALGSLAGVASGAGAWLVKALIYGLLIGVPIVSVVFFMLWRRKSKNYTYAVHWWAIDGITGGFDRGGVFVDNDTKAKRFYLKNAKTSLDADNLVWRLIGNRRVVYLQRVSSKDFRYVDTAPLAHGQSSTVGEEDVNWAIADFERNIKVFGSNTLLPLLIWGGVVLCAVVILLMIIFVLQKLPDMKEAWGTALETARVLAQSRSGTTVVP